MRALSFSAVSLLVVFPAFAANIVTNPGFETGNFSGWGLGGNYSSFTGVDSLNPHSGAFGSFFGPQGSDAFLTQTVTTEPGATYTFSFYLMNELASNNSFSASFGGASLVTETDSSAFGYTLYSFSGLVATDISSEIWFSFRHDSSFFDLDDVSVVQTSSPPSAVPEPATLPITLVAFGTVGAMRLRRRA